MYTGDEAGYLQKWDLNPMLDKLKQNEASFKARAELERQRGLTADSSSQRGSAMARRTGQSGADDGSTFITGVAQNQVVEELKITEEDVIPSQPWQAHQDGINCVTFIPELSLVATCSFDYHVYIWDCEGDNRLKVGSLLLGNKVLPPGAKMDADQRRYKSYWKI
mmetsp:Transcript_35271/g.46433  ORF Transcript_35271/g.46433 Transcript_35271/m.46433 type:complete len:165 (-) Transcript_35271:403-897(-)|eukprot:CAMPEP_0185605974 /NCGR_PEP_ID=MMETSP0436-20130131/4446_1 /TAXON_ID=626734 ORGANISM="Favella taraikaensis, Strain Fe Narragansett Bay" /NCGR_SAMPLE_ID=MMETSP0436 /ASSEMBLY_ACC=CAM_ASM_000390 /LENGTH=164 /DNA_ID=CAMNT_0028237377 /DNA_START=486 /DNA_END=980 /DNA_ORIENTATION=+